MKKLFLLFNVGLLFVGFNCLGQYLQVGSKLVGAGIEGTSGSLQGRSVSLSSNGKTLAVGGPFDKDITKGAIWIYTLSGSNWVQAGDKIVNQGAYQAGRTVSLSSNGKTLAFAHTGGTFLYTFTGSNWEQIGNEIDPNQGTTNIVGLSSDGKTIVNLGHTDSVCVYTISGRNWNPSKSKLVGPDSKYKICISGDGKTLVVGGHVNSTNTGYAWIYKYSGGNWVKVGNPIQLSAKSDDLSQISGTSFSLSYDGTILAIGYNRDNSNEGAVWVYQLVGNNWAQIGNKLVGTGDYELLTAQQGSSISLSGDGSTLAVGGDADNGYQGAVWLFKYSNNTGKYVQVGNKLVGSGLIGRYVYQGFSVSLSYDGSMLAVGGMGDNYNTGAVWLFYDSTRIGKLTDTVCTNIVRQPISQTVAGGNFAKFEVLVYGTSTFTYLWNNGETTRSITTSVPGFYTVTVTGSNGISVSNTALLANYRSEITKIEYLNNVKTTLYPNPFTESLNLMTDSEESYTIYNLQGIPVETGVSSSRSIGSQLPPGVYQVKILDKVTKVVKIAP